MIDFFLLDNGFNIRRRAKEELILTSAGEGICGLDLQGQITFINPAGAKMLGYYADELTECSWQEVAAMTIASSAPICRCFFMESSYDRW